MTTSQQVIRILQNHFAPQGIPEKDISDNGPQYSSTKIAGFCSQWDFNLTTSSPGNWKFKASVDGVNEYSKKNVSKGWLKGKTSNRSYEIMKDFEGNRRIEVHMKKTTVNNVYRSRNSFHENNTKSLIQLYVVENSMSKTETLKDDATMDKLTGRGGYIQSNAFKNHERA